MASNAIAAVGTLLKIGDGGTPEVFTTVAEVNSISGPSLTLETIDVTSHDTSNKWREFIGGLLDAGEITAEINYIPGNSTHDASTGLIADLVNRVRRNFQLVFPDAANTTWSFAALITGFEVGAEIDNKLTASITLKLSGQPTLA